MAAALGVAMGPARPGCGGLHWKAGMLAPGGAGFASTALPAGARFPPAPFLHAGRRLTAGLEQFAELVSREDDRIELARPACRSRKTPIRAGRGRLCRRNRPLCEQLRARLAPDAAAEDRVIELNEFLFDDLASRQHRRLLRSAQFLPERGHRSRTGIRSRSPCSTWRSAAASPAVAACRSGHFLVRLPLRAAR